jgi:peptidyl-tRNA hydrolase, PTH1 family
MGLFQKKPTTGSNVPLYTLGKNKSRVIVGLGNIGQEYDLTRHNIGFTCVDSFAKKNDFPTWILKKDLKCQLTQATLGDTRVIIIKPQTFMNLSGEAVQLVQNFYKIKTQDFLVVHDEVDIPFGTIRTRMAGGSAGHNGLKSIISTIGEDFGRIRIGIANELLEKVETADFVLQKFNKTELEEMQTLTKEVNTLLTETVYGEGALLADTRMFIV